MKLWQKNFLYAALLFMAIVYICVFFLSVPSVTSLLESAKTTAVSEEYAISRALDSTFNSIKTESHKNAADSFAGYYEKSGIYLEIGNGKDVLFSNLPYALAMEPGTLAWSKNGSDTYIGITDQLTSGYYFVFVKSAGDAVDSSIRQCLISAIFGTGVILALCILLYLTLKKINQPADRLAHELRTPLTAISGYAEALMISKLTEKQRYTAARYILDESKRLAAISEKLLTISSLREHGARQDNVDIEALFAHAQRTYGQVVYTAQWKRVIGDKVLLQSLINNLVANAIKASPEGAVIELSARDRQIVISDRGRGMSVEQLEYVNRPNRTENPQKRSGLGIPLCHEIVKLHKASLRFISEAGNGTQAVISFTTR